MQAAPSDRLELRNLPSLFVDYCRAAWWLHMWNWSPSAGCIRRDVRRLWWDVRRLRRRDERRLRWRDARRLRRRCSRPFGFASHWQWRAMAPPLLCWLGFGEGIFWEDLELISFNWARKASIWDDRNPFWRGIKEEEARFGARFVAGRGKTRDREGAARDGDREKVGTENVGIQPATGWEPAGSRYSAGQRTRRRLFSLSYFSLCHIIIFAYVDCI
jgi:hypothetical protein